LLGGGSAEVPHLKVGDQLGPALEDLDQWYRPIGADQRGGRIDLDHRQTPSLCRQNVTGSRVGLFLDPELIDPRLPDRPVGDLW
jgi:hypothetical protein